MNILFVCMGNRCRSAMAEVIFRDMAVRYGLPVQVDSAGLTIREDADCPQCACQAVAELGLSLEEHQPKMLTKALTEQSDRIICMSEQVRRRLLQQYPDCWERTECLSQVVDDPLGHGFEAYRDCVKALRVLLIQWMLAQHFPGVTWREKFPQK